MLACKRTHLRWQTWQERVGMDETLSDKRYKLILKDYVIEKNSNYSSRDQQLTYVL